MPRLLLTAALVISGGAALIYETIWTRQLGLLMGHTVAAATCVLAAFMLGLAAGAAAGGRIAVRSSPASALRAAALFEVLIGGLALVLPAEIAGLHPLLGWTYGDAGGPAFAVTRFGTALIVVLLPALAMGATLPLVVRWAIGSTGQAGREVAWLYAANSSGAAVGAVLSGFVLLPAIGMHRATVVAAALNGIAAALLEGTARLPSRQNRSTPAALSSAPVLPARSRKRPAITLALGLSGAASLILQLAWTRILSLVLGPTTYAFSTMVATFIAGIALGSLTAGWIGRGRPSPVSLVIGLVATGIAAVAAAAWTPHLTSMVADAASTSGGFDSVMWEQALLVGFMMLPMTIGFGAAFPLAVGLAATDDRGIPLEVAAIYTANTLGALVGAIGGGYLLIPSFGLQVTVFIAADLCLAAGVVIWIAHAPHVWSRLAGAALLTGLGAGAWFVPSWDRALVSSGAYKYAAYLPPENRDALLRAGELLYYREGAASTVSVRRVAGATTLAIDGKVDASNAGDMLTQRLLAHVPLLLHPDPHAVAIIGLGSGVTLGSALRHPVSRVDTIEVSPQVIEASRHFSVENGHALDDPRARVILGDGRTHLTFGRQRYDVIVSEPSNPWIAGVAGLFTREMFEIVRARLAPGGIACQWAHVYDMSDEDLRSIVGTFAAVFPQTQIWKIGDTDILLVGADDPLESHLAALPRNWNRPGVAADLAGVSVRTPEVLVSLLAGTSADLKVFAAGAATQRDDRLALEFSGPRSAFGQADGTSPGVLRARALSSLSRSQADGEFHRDRGLMLLAAEAFASAAADLMISVKANPDDALAIEGLLRAAGPASELDRAEELLRAAIGSSVPKVAPAIGLSRVLASRRNFEAAAAVLRPAIDAATSTAPLEQLASVFADAGDPRLSRVVSGLQRMDPDSDAAAYFSAVLALAEGRPYDAIDVLSRQRKRDSAGFREITLLGTAYAALGRHVEARQAFRDAVRKDPRNAAGYENLATAELAAGDFQAASGHFAEALLLDSASSVAQKGLADARGRHR